MLIRPVVLAALFLATCYILLVFLLVSVQTPWIAQYFLLGGSVIALGVAWFLSHQGLRLGSLFLALYLARVLGAVPLALLMHLPLFPHVLSSVTFGVFSPSTGLNLSSAVLSVAWMLALAGIGSALGRLSSKGIDADKPAV